jgi:hypothetical protein
LDNVSVSKCSNLTSAEEVSLMSLKWETIVDIRLIRETSSAEVKFEHFETDTLSKGNGSQFEEIELVQLDSSDEEMTE